jgi:hypothetical protein
MSFLQSEAGGPVIEVMVLGGQGNEIWNFAPQCQETVASQLFDPFAHKLAGSHWRVQV